MRTCRSYSSDLHIMFMIILLYLSAYASISFVESATVEQWKDKVVYQILTDRFDTNPTTLTPCEDLTDYCGGTFKGIFNRLDYIKGLGVDAIWISPVITNVDGGYHGYWAKNLYTINENFGTEDDLAELIKGAHDRELLVMVDVVTNHMGERMEDIPQVVPFNDTAHYHE